MPTATWWVTPASTRPYRRPSRPSTLASTTRLKPPSRIIIADHGNADNAVNADGTPNTAHSLNPVPFVYVTKDKNATVENGILADVAPSILHIMGLQQPEEMTGRDLIKG